MLYFLSYICHVAKESLFPHDRGLISNSSGRPSMFRQNSPLLEITTIFLWGDFDAHNLLGDDVFVIIDI